MGRFAKPEQRDLRAWTADYFHRLSAIGYRLFSQ